MGQWRDRATGRATFDPSIDNRFYFGGPGMQAPDLFSFITASLLRYFLPAKSSRANL
jgi:hypothetical protein